MHICLIICHFRNLNTGESRYQFLICIDADIVQSGPPEAAMLQYVMHLLAVEDIEGLPPGGGINAKWVFH